MPECRNVLSPMTATAGWRPASAAPRAMPTDAPMQTQDSMAWNLAVSVVIAGLLFWTGVGAMASQRIMTALGGPRFVAYALAGVVLLEQQLLIGWLQGRIGSPFAGRVALVLAYLLPLGVLLGAFFPWALERLKAASPAFAPWAWGINGMFSVVGPILGVAISTTWGMGALMLAAIPVYLLAAASLPDPAP
jgi:hypothetical protein